MQSQANARLVGSDVIVAEKLFSCMGRHGAGGSADLAWQALEDVGTALASAGRALYELCDDGEGFMLQRFPSHGAVKMPGAYVQRVPKNDRDLWQQSWAIIPRRRVWEVRIPRYLGGLWGYRRTLYALGKYDTVSPRFMKKELKQGRLPENWDVESYTRAMQVYVRRASRRWGWDKRDPSSRWMTDFYIVYSSLRFAEATALLREHIVFCFNRLLQGLGIECRVEVDGLAKSKELVTIRKDLSSGRIGLSEGMRAAFGS